ncbi:hypothetical protein DSL72_009064 [Monilinia vaccinii-corymbosi]|uniref:Uncharacterized protein n=1 Tax=Monilinia vaccinii-corymbosi TaxID=61207 RepID=A0A8A3PNB4_9HELO|nr:hypothetical protein DSL72_009064 [Monilinia vaccinii-corymbosi]
MDDDLAYGTMDTDRPENVADSNERVERPKNDRRKTTYTFPIKIMPSPKSATSTSLIEEFTEVETQAYYNESLDYNYISSRFAFSLGLRPDADRPAKPRSKSVSKPKTPFKPKHLVRSQTAPVSEIRPLQRSKTEPLSRRTFSPLARENASSEDAPVSTSTDAPIRPRIPPRRTSTTATLVPSNSEAPPIFSLLEPKPQSLARSSLTSPLFPNADLNPFSPRPGATFGAMVVDTPPRTPHPPSLLRSLTESTPSLFEALNSHPVIQMPNIPAIVAEETENISEEPEDLPEESERNLEGMGTGTGIGMGFGIGEEVRGRDQDQDPNSMSGDLTLHWRSPALSRYTQRTVFWIVPDAKFDVVFGHDETDFNVPVHNSMKWGLGGWGLGCGGGEKGEKGRRNERNQFREGIRRGVLKKVEEQSSFSLLHSATNIMDMWLRPPYPTHVRGNSRNSDSKTPLLGNVDDQGRNIHDVPLTFPELENQLRNELSCTEERRRKHEAKRAVNIWDVRAGKAVLAEQAKGASGEIRKLVGAVVKDVKAREGGKRVANGENPNGVGRASPVEEEAEAAHDKAVHQETAPGPSAADASNKGATQQPQPQPEISSSPLKTESIPSAPLPAPSLPNPTTFELTPTTANQTRTQSPSSSLRVEFTDAQIQEQIQAQMDRETEREAKREAEREMEREIQAQMEREIQNQIAEETRAQATPPPLPPRPKRISITANPNVNSESALTGASEASQEDNTRPEPKTNIPPNIHASISKIRAAHAHDDEGDSDDDGNEVMSEINLSKIPVHRLELDDLNLEDLERMSEVHLPGPAFGSLGQRFNAKWEMEDERIHPERRVWRRNFRGVLGELLRVREVRV